MRQCVNSAEKVARKDTPANRSSDEDSIDPDIIEFMWNDGTLQERGAACDGVVSEKQVVQEEYRKAIVELIEVIQDESALRRIYNLAQYLYSK